MSDSKQIAATGRELRARSEHLRVLNSAWAVLARFGLSTETHHIVATGRAVSEELAELAGRPPEGRDPGALPKLDKLLGAIEVEMRSLAFEVPVAQLRSTLPRHLPGERRGVLDLLDVMLVAELEGHDGSEGRISAIDYLITLLCNGDGSVLEDPVGLTPRLFLLCELAGADDDPRLAEIEAEFYVAANVNEGDAREEIQMRALRRRKRELGRGFFAPRVLRAIVAYNAAMSRCLDRGVWDSRDWGSLAGAVEEPDAVTSVFETEVLPRLAAALRRRAEGQAPSSSAVDRIAWCLDLASLGELERSALLAPSAGQPGDLEGTAMLIGLLCRSAVVLEEELPAIGISPERLSSEWVRELDDALQREVNTRIAGDRYEVARALSELRNTFLYSLMTGEHRGKRHAGRPPEPLPSKPVGREARQLANEAVEQEAAIADGATPAHWKRWRSWPWRAINRLASVAALVGLLAFGLAHVFLNGDLDRMSGAELTRVSPYLERGGRNGEGRGPAFVGTIDAAWLALPAGERNQAAIDLVTALREQGVREIMVYDGQRRLRIQALGQQSVRVLATESP